MDATAPLLAGAAEVDITPKVGTQLAGDIGRYRPAETLLDPIFSRALVLQSGDERTCLLSLDVICVLDEWATVIRRRASERFGLAPEAIMVHSTQNHAAPSIGDLVCRPESTIIPPEYPWLRGGDETYNEFAVERILITIGLAIDGLQPAGMAWASGLETRVAFNRRFVMRDGTTATHVGGDALRRVLHVEGPMDPEVGVMCFTGKDLRLIGAILHHTCHPTAGYPMRFVTADWPGAWVEGFRAACGGAGVPMVLNGFCGNIHSCNHLDPSHDSSPRRMGERLTETSAALLPELRYQDNVPLSHASQIVRIPLRTLTEADVQAARDIIDAHPEPDWLDEAHTQVAWDWVYAASTIDFHERQQSNPAYDCEIQAFRIGDVGIVGVGGEPFVEGQLAIKGRSPAARTFLGHMCNGFAGYIQTKQAFEGGGYEARAANWSRLHPDALEMISTVAIEVLRGLFPEG